MSKPAFVVIALGLLNLAIYLFVQAPPPLDEGRGKGAQVPIERVLSILDAENAKVRGIYTRDIVGAGLKVGLQFDEEWKEDDVHAGPLPALFLRETARHLERRPVELGLFLGSRFPIREANQFSGEQATHFARIEKSGQPAFFRSSDTGRATAMFADRAVADACVSCHNEHPNSPKNDWARGDLMGATTWTHPAKSISLSELLELVDALRGSVAESYASYLEKARRFDVPPSIGARWPADGYALPTTDVFMARVRSASGPDTLEALLSARFDAAEDASQQAAKGAP